MRLELSAGTIAPAVAWAVITAGAGAVLTELGPWYRNLRKPAWQPPDWLFGPVWTTIFLLSALAGALAWSAADAGPADRAAIGIAYVANGLLNAGWSLLFFKLRRPDWALVETGALLLSVVAMIAVVRPQEPWAAWLLAPYLAWVCFAGVLNRTIVRLNRPFGLR